MRFERYIRRNASPDAGIYWMNKISLLGMIAALVTVPVGAALADAATITSPVTGRIWMDRNLGAERAAENAMDDPAFGAIYRWNSAKAYPGNSILNTAPWDPRIWGDDTINLKPGAFKSKTVEWSDDGWEPKNNPCPSGFNIPTKAEWEAEKIVSAADAFTKLRLPMAMYRAKEGYTQGLSWIERPDGSYAPEQGNYWSRTTQGEMFFYYLWATEKKAAMGFVGTAYGFSIRCIKNL